MLTDQTFFRFDDVTVDCKDFRVLKGVQKIDLTPRAFDVLHFLLRNCGRVVEKQEIFDQVWKRTFVGDNALTKIIKEIRGALDDDANNPRYIETVPKRGYRFIADLSERITPLLPEGAWPEAEVVAAAGGSNKSQDSTVESHKPEKENQRPKAKDPSRKMPLVLFAGIITVVLAATAFFYYFTRGDVSNKQTSSSPIDSIAVLPFENVSQDPIAEYLSDGITESLINRLSLLSNLKVMSRSSIVQYKGKEQDAKKVGNKLNVRAVLSGSVKQVGDQIVITVRLDDAQNDRHIWGEQYIRKFSDILNLQREITVEVSNNLRTRLTGADEQKLAKAYTTNPESYLLYLKGRFYWNKRTGEAIKKSIEYFNQAIEKDPNFALAYVGLADSYVVPANPLPPGEKMPKAKAAAMRALELDDTMAEAHTALARTLTIYDWDWIGAEKEFKRAIVLNPRYAVAHEWYGTYFEMLGRYDESIAERKRAQELDPLSLIINFELGTAFYYGRDYDRAIEQFQKTLELDPNFPPVYPFLAAAYEQKGMYDQAVAGFQKGITQRGGTEWSFSKSGLGHIYAVSGKSREARTVLDELKQLSQKEYVPADGIALIYAGLGDKEAAFAWLEKAYEEHAFKMAFLKVEPRWDNLRADPRYRDLLRRIGLKP